MGKYEHIKNINGAEVTLASDLSKIINEESDDNTVVEIRMLPEAEDENSLIYKSTSVVVYKDSENNKIIIQNYYEN